MSSFLLILTLCGSLHTSGNRCEEFIIDTDQTEVSCLQGIQGVYNRDNQRLLGFMQDASNDWFKTVDFTELHCIIEDKE